MKILNKNNIFYGVAIVGLIAYLFKREDITRLPNYASLSQYRNRLSEFYLQEDLDERMKEMCGYINHGVNSDDAFSMVILASNIEKF